MTPEKERAEQIANARAAYRRGEITFTELVWFCIITAKFILDAARAAESETV